VESFSLPTPEQRSHGADAVPSYHGYTGPVHVTFPQAIFTGPEQPAFRDTLGKLGVSISKDLNGGESNVVAFIPSVSSVTCLVLAGLELTALISSP
jgi:choline dehydrogenase